MTRFFFTLCGTLLFSLHAYAKKTNQPIYEDNFDLAGGGASLTKASQFGVLFSNPALLAFGPRFHRYAGAKFSLLTSKESIEFAQGLAGGVQPSNEEIIDTVFTTPVHFGYSLAVGYMNRFGGFAVFSRLEPDLRARRFGDSGLPQVDLGVESYHGVGVSLASQTALEWLSVGATLKYLYVADPTLSVEVTDQESLSKITDSAALQAKLSHNTGVGLDVGSLMSLQGKHVDYRLALKADDLGDSRMSGKGETKSFKQVLSAGTGLTLHSEADAIHLAVDYRDLQNVYEEEMFKKVYAGVKVTLRTYIGVAAGYYNGFPSYGAEIDLIFLRVAGTFYTREFGDHPGVDPRSLYVISLAAGY